MTRQHVTVALAFVLLGLLPGIAFALDAQSASRAQVGLHVGLGSSVFDLSKERAASSTARIGPSAGVIVLLPRNHYSFLRTGLEIRPSGGAYSRLTGFSIFESQTPPPTTTSISLTYLAAPVAVRVSPFSVARGFHIDAGLESMYLVSAQAVRRPGIWQVDSHRTRGRSSFYSWGLGWFAGVGTDLPTGRCKAYLELGYRRSLTPTWRSDWSDSVGEAVHALVLDLGVWL